MRTALARNDTNLIWQLFFTGTVHHTMQEYMTNVTRF